MKEVAFIRQRIEKWRKYESVAASPELTTADEMTDAYIDVTSDLAFARTHYPHSRITLYLNNMASAIHNSIYRNKRERLSRIFTFWTTEMPHIVWEARRELRLSLLIFVVCALIGAFSQWCDPEFARHIMGDAYVDMTLENIAEGEPMAVYATGPSSQAFTSITINNIYVSFLCFVSGVLTSFATGFLLLSNGVMLGCFQTFFIQKDLFWPSFLAVWLHGTIEISSIIVAGAAGITMGNGWLFPGSYPRLYAFRRGAMRGLKIVIGTMPLFVIAGFIESYLTRHTEWPDAVRGAIILCSFLFIVFYYIVLPYIKFGNHGHSKSEN